MDTVELNSEDTQIEDLTVNEGTVTEVKGGDGETGAGAGRINISSFNFMKKVD